MRKILILLCLTLITPAFSALDSKAIISKVQNYLNENQNIKGDFTQESSNNAKAKGSFYISRPGKMKLVYSTPMVLVSDGKNLIYQDKKLDQITTIPLNSVPAGMLFKKDINLINGKEVSVDAIKEKEGFYELTLSLADDPGVGTLKVYFKKSPFTLNGWETKDATGLTTRVSLKNIKNAEKFTSDFFTIKKQKIQTVSGEIDTQEGFY